MQNIAETCVRFDAAPFIHQLGFGDRGTHVSYLNSWCSMHFKMSHCAIVVLKSQICVPCWWISSHLFRRTDTEGT